jgi:hypothetical protein
MDAREPELPKGRLQGGSPLGWRVAVGAREAPALCWRQYRVPFFRSPLKIPHRLSGYDGPDGSSFKFPAVKRGVP